MKNLILITLLGFLYVSCETEEMVVKNAPENNLAQNAVLKNKLMRVAQSPSALDNFIDQSSCFAVKFPFTVSIGSDVVNVSSENDYQEVRDVLAQDDDPLIIQYPVTVIFPDYTERTLTSQSEYTAALAACTPSIELSCIALQYPVTIKSYNSQNQLAQAFTLENKKALYTILDDDSFYDALAIDYPVSITTPAGITVVIDDNTALEALIDNYTDECLAALEPSTNPNPVFEDVIAEGTWYVSYFFRDNDQTNDYEDFDFDFNSNGTVTVTGGGPPTGGSWNAYTDSGEEKVDFSFSSSQLEELSEDWTITSFTTTLIKLEHESGGGDEIRYLYLTRN
jgi:hypothetical protein